MRPSGTPPPRRGLRTAPAAAAALVSLCVGVAGALAQGGGITVPDPPDAGDVVCIATCGGMHKATADSKVQISGRHLKHVTRVAFNSRRGGRIKVRPASVSSRSVTAKVPERATTGRPKVSDSYDNGSTSRTKLRIVPSNQIPSSGGFKLKTVAAKPRKAYFYGTKKPKATFMFSNSEPTDVRIDVVKRNDGTVVDSWIKPSQEPNTVHVASWNGLKEGGKPADDGGYRFRIGPESGTMETASKAKFTYHRFRFPIRGSHSYGDGVGAPRSGHTHQGQDLPASCGTKLVAARGGRVQWRDYQGGGAGNYVVIDGKKTRHDFVYMHLKKPSRLHKGERVRTGQKIGAVGTTGSSSGCHLHFEEWSGPGWYEGGRPLKAVTKHLKQWDGWS